MSSQGKGLARLSKWVSFSGSGNQPWYGKSQVLLATAWKRWNRGPTSCHALPAVRGGPEWYAVGKPCSTEITAYKYSP